LYLKIPDERSRGRGNIDGAAGPFPFPSGPWQTAHRCANTLFPMGVSWSKSAPGGHVRSAYCAASGRYSFLATSSATRAQIERPTSSASNTAPKISMTPRREPSRPPTRNLRGSRQPFRIAYYLLRRTWSAFTKQSYVDLPFRSAPPRDDRTTACKLSTSAGDPRRTSHREAMVDSRVPLSLHPGQFCLRIRPRSPEYVAEYPSGNNKDYAHGKPQVDSKRSCAKYFPTW